MDLKTGKIRLVESGDGGDAFRRRLPSGRSRTARRSSGRITTSATRRSCARCPAASGSSSSARSPARSGGSIPTTRARCCGSSRPARAARSAASSGARRPTIRPLHIPVVRRARRRATRPAGLFALKLTDRRAGLAHAGAEARMQHRPRLHRRAVGAGVGDSRRRVLRIGRRPHARVLDARTAAILWDFNTVARVRDGEPRAGQGRIDRRGRPGDRRRAR